MPGAQQKVFNGLYKVFYEKQKPPPDQSDHSICYQDLKKHSLQIYTPVTDPCSLQFTLFLIVQPDIFDGANFRRNALRPSRRNLEVLWNVPIRSHPYLLIARLGSYNLLCFLCSLQRTAKTAKIFTHQKFQAIQYVYLMPGPHGQIKIAVYVTWYNINIH